MKTIDSMLEVYYYQWSVSRWRASETRAQLDTIGRGIYREILDICYVQGSIPSDLHILAAQCDCPLEELQRIWPIIGRHFYTDKHDNSRLRNKVSDVVRKQFYRHIARQKRLGKKGGLAKAHKHKQISSGGSSQENRREENIREENSLLPQTKPFAVPIQQYGDWIETKKAIHEYFPECDLPFINSLVAACAQTFAGVTEPKCKFTDQLVADAIRRVHRPGQTSAGLFSKTVPACIRTWATDGVHARASPMTAQERQHQRLLDIAKQQGMV